MVLKIIELLEYIPANNFPEEELQIQRHAHSQIDLDLRFVCRGQKLHPTSGRTI
jgi:hypothetical protein